MENENGPINVRMVTRDITEYCQGVPAGARVLEKGLAIDGEATYCCSMTPSAYVFFLRHELEPIDSAAYNATWTAERANRWNEYEELLTSEQQEHGYYVAYKTAMNAPLDIAWGTNKAEDYETIAEALEAHTCNHCF